MDNSSVDDKTPSVLLYSNLFTPPKQYFPFLGHFWEEVTQTFIITMSHKPTCVPQMAVKLIKQPPTATDDPEKPKVPLPIHFEKGL